MVVIRGVRMQACCVLHCHLSREQKPFWRLVSSLGVVVRLRGDAQKGKHESMH